jgi:catechol 2,3-dioxygenase-like lactoylglutathione lyase family enzyme
MTYPRAFSHIGLSVPDIDRAVAWYRDVLGFTVLIGPVQNDGDDISDLGRLNRGVFGPRFNKSKVAHLVTSNGIGIELFQFIDPAFQKPDDNFAYSRGGIFHFCIVDPDIEQMLAEIVSTGGKARCAIATLFEGNPPHRMVYCEDPFGNPFEIYTHSYEQFFSNRSY